MFAISDNLWQGVIAGLVAMFGGIVTILLALIKSTGEKVHTLVNSQMGAQLLLVRNLSEDKAISDPTPVNIEAARIARTAYEDHQRKQSIVDGRKD